MPSGSTAMGDSSVGVVNHNQAQTKSGQKRAQPVLGHFVHVGHMHSSCWKHATRLKIKPSGL